MNIERSSGTGVTTTNALLTFTPANYAVPQPVYFTAATDSDPYASRAEFSVSSAGLANQIVRITASDAENGSLQFTDVARSNDVTRLEIAAEPQVNIRVDASTDLLGWIRLTNEVAVTDSITIRDERTNSPPFQFYRAITEQ